MTLLLVLLVPVVAWAVARWAWRLQVRALELLGPGIAKAAGAPDQARMAEVVSVLVDDDSVLVGLGPARALSGRRRDGTARICESSVVLSVGERDQAPVARLARWQAAGAQVLVWRDGAQGTIELCQLQSGRSVRLPVVDATPGMGGAAAH